MNWVTRLLTHPPHLWPDVYIELVCPTLKYVFCIHKQYRFVSTLPAVRQREKIIERYAGENIVERWWSWVIFDPKRLVEKKRKKKKYIYMYTRLHECTHARAHTRTHTRARNACACKHAHACAHTHTYTTHAHASTHLHTHTHVQEMMKQYNTCQCTATRQHLPSGISDGTVDRVARKSCIAWNCQTKDTLQSQLKYTQKQNKTQHSRRSSNSFFTCTVLA